MRPFLCSLTTVVSCRLARRAALLFALPTVCALLGLCAPRAATAQGLLYVTADNNGTGEFGLMNPTTGATTLLGNTGSIQIGGIALHGSSLYGVQYLATGSDEFYKINPLTGALTTLGSTGQNLVGLTETANGTLWSASTNGNLYTINPATGASTLVGAFGFDTVGTLATSANNNIYLTGTANETGTGTNVFDLLNQTNGAATTIANPAYGEVFGMATLHNVMYVQNTVGDLYSINPSNGALTTLGTYNTGTVGVVYASAAAVPAPSALPIFALGAPAGVGFLIRRRRICASSR